MSTLVTTALRHNASASNNMVLDSSGRVGIGIATPTAALHVAGTLQSQVGSSFAQMYADGGAAYFTSVGGFPSIFLTSGTERMRIDASGRVTKPSQPMFYARGAETNYTLTNGADMPFNNAVFNIGNHFNTSTFRFTAPVTGYYFIAFHLFVQTASNRVSIKVNNTAYNNNQMNVNTGTNNWAGVMFLNANDFVSVGDWQNTSGATFYMGHCTFSGYLLG